jgi:protein-L-isoaspartate(D-aspartate) O-methyltransferase
VLEIGAGTGYNAALLSELVGPTGHVTTVDVDPDMVALAMRSLAASGHTSNVTLVHGDGAHGFPIKDPTTGSWQRTY